MTYTEQQVVAIVLEVFRRLEGLAGTYGARPCTCAASAGRVGGSDETEEGRAGASRGVAEASGVELTLAERVISQQLVANRLAGIGRVVVGPRAVVTPLVRDELKRRGIELVRRGAP